MSFRAMLAAASVVALVLSACGGAQEGTPAPPAPVDEDPGCCVPERWETPPPEIGETPPDRAAGDDALEGFGPD